MYIEKNNIFISPDDGVFLPVLGHRHRTDTGVAPSRHRDPDRRELGRAVGRLFDHGHPIDGAEDHGATVSVYLRDPDRNGIELYYDRPREEWFDTQGNPVLKAEAFDLRELLTKRGPRSQGKAGQSSKED